MKQFGTFFEDYFEKIGKAIGLVVAGLIGLFIYVFVPLGLIYIFLAIVLYPFGIKL
jgi:hypothetical protein